MKIRIGVEKRAAILEMLESDVKFLSQLKIMDYSLLLGVHNVAQVSTPTRASIVSRMFPTFLILN